MTTIIHTSRCIPVYEGHVYLSFGFHTRFFRFLRLYANAEALAANVYEEQVVQDGVFLEQEGPEEPSEIFDSALSGSTFQSVNLSDASDDGENETEDANICNLLALEDEDEHIRISFE